MHLMKSITIPGPWVFLTGLIPGSEPAVPSLPSPGPKENISKSVSRGWFVTRQEYPGKNDGKTSRNHGEWKSIFCWGRRGEQLLETQHVSPSCLGSKACSKVEDQQCATERIPYKIGKGTDFQEQEWYQRGAIACPALREHLFSN